MLDDFVQRFKTLVDTLTSHPRIRITHLWIGPPATDDALAELSQEWGHPVPAALRTLYRQANGLQLRWVDIGNEYYDPARDDPMRFDGPWHYLPGERGVAAGLLDVPTIDQLRSHDTVGAAYGDDEHPEYLDRAVSIDHFGEQQDAVLFFGDGKDDPWICVAMDALADVDPPPGEQTLSQYLDRVLATWASIDHRTREAPRALDGILRERIELDPTRLVGQRVVYAGGQDGSLMHGRVLSLINLENPPRHWWFGPTVVEVVDDLGETVYVPLRALFPPDDADDYEALYADPSALRALLRGPGEPIFASLASLETTSYRVGLVDGPSISTHAWPHMALTTKLSPREAVGALLAGAETSFQLRDAHTARPIAWPRTRPLRPGRTTMAPDTLAVGLFDAAVLHIGRAAPGDLVGWLDPDDTKRLRRLLQRFQARNRLRGYDPLDDLSTTPGFVSRALRGGPTALNTEQRSPQRGGKIGLADLRVVEV